MLYVADFPEVLSNPGFGSSSSFHTNEVNNFQFHCSLLDFHSVTCLSFVLTYMFMLMYALSLFCTLNCKPRLMYYSFDHPTTTVAKYVPCKGFVILDCEVITYVQCTRSVIVTYYSLPMPFGTLLPSNLVFRKPIYP